MLFNINKKFSIKPSDQDVCITIQITLENNMEDLLCIYIQQTSIFQKVFVYNKKEM